MDLPRVKQLPGAPHHETVELSVTFDPRGANLDLGNVNVSVPINVSIRLHIRTDYTACQMWRCHHRPHSLYINLPPAIFPLVNKTIRHLEFVILSEFACAELPQNSVLV